MGQGDCKVMANLSVGQLWRCLIVCHGLGWSGPTIEAMTVELHRRLKEMR